MDAVGRGGFSTGGLDLAGSWISPCRMRQVLRCAASALALAMVSTSPLRAAAKADALTRKASLGVQLEPAQGGAESASGMRFRAARRLRSGFALAILSLRSTARRSARRPRWWPWRAPCRAGSDVAFELSRGGAPLTLRGKASPSRSSNIRERSSIIGSLAFRDGRLRDILVLPAAAPDSPVVFYLQGYSCGSIEGGPGAFYQRLGANCSAAESAITGWRSWARATARARSSARTWISRPSWRASRPPSATSSGSARSRPSGSSCSAIQWAGSRLRFSPPKPPRAESRPMARWCGTGPTITTISTPPNLS